MQFLGFHDTTAFWVIRRIPLLDYLETVSLHILDVMVEGKSFNSTQNTS